MGAAIRARCTLGEQKLIIIRSCAVTSCGLVVIGTLVPTTWGAYREMVLYRVYSEPFVNKYYSTICSYATLFQVVSYCLVLVPPIFLAYVTNGMVL